MLLRTRDAPALVVESGGVLATAPPSGCHAAWELGGQAAEGNPDDWIVDEFVPRPAMSQYDVPGVIL